VIADARERVEGMRAELDGAIEARIEECRRCIRELRLRLRSPDTMVRDMRLRTGRLGINLIQTGVSAFEKRRRQVGGLAGRLDALSPLKVLDRGYAVVINQRDSHAVLDAAAVKFGDELEIRLAKGRLTARTIGRTI
jgi:exodeoxyribonuclease VII large subunit